MPDKAARRHVPNIAPTATNKANLGSRYRSPRTGVEGVVVEEFISDPIRSWVAFQSTTLSGTVRTGRCWCWAKW